MALRLSSAAFGVLVPFTLVSQLAGCGNAGSLATLSSQSDRGGESSAQSDDAGAPDGLLALNLANDLLKDQGERMTVNVTDAKGLSQTQTVVNGGGAFRFTGLALGAAQIKIAVFAADGQLRFEGDGKAVVSSGGPAIVTISLREIQAEGGLTIVVKRPDPVAVQPPAPVPAPIPQPAPLPIPDNSRLQLDANALWTTTLSAIKAVPGCFGYDLEVTGNRVSFRECKDVNQPFETVFEIKSESRIRVVAALNSIKAVRATANGVPAVGAVTYRIGVVRSKCERVDFQSYEAGFGPVSFDIASFSAAKDEILRIARTEGRAVLEGEPRRVMRTAVCLPEGQGPVAAPVVVPVLPSTPVQQPK